MTVEIAARDICPDCFALEGKIKENLSEYKDGWYCHRCGYKKLKNEGLSLVAGYETEIAKSGITYETCKKYNIRAIEYSGYVSSQFKDVKNELMYIFPIYEKGKVVAQIIKSVNNKKIIGYRGKKVSSLFGMEKFNPTKKLPLIITTGLKDAPAAYQMIGLPAVSALLGDKSLAKGLQEHLDYCLGWLEIILCVDNDKSGQAIIEEVVPIFEPGFVKVAVLPLKDAEDMLEHKRIDEFKKCIWNAQKYKPKSVVSLLDLIDEVSTPVQWGDPWPWHFMDLVTYGIRNGEVTVISADAGIGKTLFTYCTIAKRLSNNQACAHFDLERSNRESGQRTLGLIMNEAIHIPGFEGFDREKIRAKVEEIGELMHYYNNSAGYLKIDNIVSSMRYLNKAYGVTLFVIDNLLALSCYIPGNGVSHEFAAQAIGRMAQISKELMVHTIVLNHVVKDKDRTSENNWQTGKMPTMDDIYGGKAVAALSDNVINLARDTLNEDDNIKKTLLVRPMKSKYHSTYTGKVFRIKFDSKSGMLI